MVLVVQDAVKKETQNIAVGTSVGCILVIAAFFILHQLEPEMVPFDYTVILAAVVGLAVAVGNFFWMGLTVQKIAEMSEEENARARSTMMVSLRYRMMMQLGWVIVAILAPCFNVLAGVLPLFIPSIVIKIRGIISARKGR